MIQKLKCGTRYCPKKKEFTAGGKWLEGDSEVSREELTEKEFRIARARFF